MYSPRLEYTDDPLRGKGWTLPRQFRGATLGHRAPEAVKVWMDQAVAGKVFRGYGPFAGSGITVVASDLADEEWVTALVSDLVRRDRTLFTASQVRVTSLMDMNEDIRAVKENRAAYRDPLLLVVSSVTVDNQWALTALASLIESRYQRALPTIALVARESWKVINSDRSPSPSLTKSLPHRNIVVEV